MTKTIKTIIYSQNVTLMLQWNVQNAERSSVPSLARLQ